MTEVGRQFSSCSSIRQQPEQKPDWNEPSEAVCHQSRPARKRRGLLNWRRVGIQTASWTSIQSWLLLVVVGLLLCCQQADGKTHAAHRLQRRTELVFDKGVPPEPRVRLKPRNEALHEPGHKSHGRKADDSGLQKAVESSQIPLPQPFDTSLGNNFTAPSCPTFFNSFLTNDTFNNCLPFSLLLQVCLYHFRITMSRLLILFQSDLQWLLRSYTLPLPRYTNTRRNLQRQLRPVFLAHG